MSYKYISIFRIVLIIIINFIILSIQNVKMFVKKVGKKGRPAKKKAFYRKNYKKKEEGGRSTSLFETIFLNMLSPYDIILRIISR